MTVVDYPHQKTGAAFLAERCFALLADSPGLGKTKTTIAAADLLGVRRILVLCPGALRCVWEDEFARWQAIDRSIFVEEGFLTKPPSQDGVTITGHAALSDVGTRSRVGSIAWLAAGSPYDLIIIDESAEFRRYAAERSRSLLGPDGLASRARYVWLLSGTPVVNSAADLYPIVFGALRSPIDWLDFCRHYCEMRPDGFLGEKPFGVRNAAELARGLSPYVLRRTVESLGIPLPPLSVGQVKIKVLEGDLLRAMAGIGRWTPEALRLALEVGDELRDAELSRTRRALGIAKAEAAAAHVESILAAGDGPAVCFFQHTDVRVAMHGALTRAGRVVSYIDGTITAAQLRTVRAWFDASRLDALLVQTQAGGTGLTLTRSHRVVIAEFPWTAAALEQAVKRVHRISQTEVCRADVLIAEGNWLDEVMSSVVERKRRATDELMGLLTTNT